MSKEKPNSQNVAPRKAVSADAANRIRKFLRFFPDGFRDEKYFARKDRSRAVRFSTDLNGGGATIRVITTNGGVHINTPDKSR